MNLLVWYRSLMRSVGATLVKLIATATSGLVSFTTNVIRPVKVTCEFSPVQEGTGDPSPDNVRPISGWTSATIYHTGKNVWGGRHAADQIKSVAGSKANFSSDDDGNYISLGGVVGNPKRLSLGVKFKPNTAYTLILKARCSDNTNFTIRIYYTDGTQLALSPSATYSETQIYCIVTNANKTVRGVYTLNRSQTLYIYYDYFGLFEGSISADDYESYQDLTLPINWETEAGTVYGGTVTLNEDGSADLVVTQAKWVEDGHREPDIAVWSRGSDSQDYNRTLFGRLPSGMEQETKNGAAFDLFICNNRRMAGASANLDYPSFGAYTVPGYSFSYTIPKGIETKAEIAAYFADNPSEICYNLLTPKTYHFPSIAKLNAFLGENNIWHNMNGSITAEYYNKQ